MPDKMEHSFGFSCDGPGRGGTCDISAWDSFYLATFWMLNSNTWISFYFHYKHLTPRQFSESSTYIYTPLALSIVQARFIGLVHFSTGLILTYPPFIIGATS